MKVTKAVILAAGLGTRMLPATKSIPKELYPIVDKPALQHHVEELAKSGIKDILIVISRGKTLIEDHFDNSPELEERLLAANKTKAYEETKKTSELANIMYVRQKEITGTGDAVRMARNFTGDDPFVVMYGDDVIINDDYPVTKQLIDVYENYECGIAGVQEVSREMIRQYSTMEVSKIKGNIYKLTDMIEKPSDNEILSLFTILGRLILPAKIYDILEETPFSNGELQLTDAMKTLAKTDGMIAVDFEGKRYDMGNKLSVMQAQVERAAAHSEIGEEFKRYLKEYVKTI